MVKATKAIRASRAPDKTIRTTAGLIAAMGGAAHLARWCGISLEMAGGYLHHGIPTGWHFRLAHELERRGFAVDGKRLGWC
jgi:hypothetical protein